MHAAVCDPTPGENHFEAARTNQCYQFVPKEGCTLEMEIHDWKVYTNDYLLPYCQGERGEADDEKFCEDIYCHSVLNMNTLSLESIGSSWVCIGLHRIQYRIDARRIVHRTFGTGQGPGLCERP